MQSLWRCVRDSFGWALTYGHPHCNTWGRAAPRRCSDRSPPPAQQPPQPPRAVPRDGGPSPQLSGLPATVLWLSKPWWLRKFSKLPKQHRERAYFPASANIPARTPRAPRAPVPSPDHGDAGAKFIPAKHPELQHPPAQRLLPRVLHPQAWLPPAAASQVDAAFLKNSAGKTTPRLGAGLDRSQGVRRSPSTNAGSGGGTGQSHPLADGSNPHPGSIRSSAGIAQTAPAAVPSRYRTASHRPRRHRY